MNGGNLKIELGALRNWSWEPEIFKQLCLTKEWAIKLDWVECVKQHSWYDFINQTDQTVSQRERYNAWILREIEWLTI